LASKKIKMLGLNSGYGLNHSNCIAVLWPAHHWQTAVNQKYLFANNYGYKFFE
jgi:hypothetical protein